MVGYLLKVVGGTINHITINLDLCDLRVLRGD